MPKFKPGKRSSDPNTAAAHLVKLATGQLPSEGSETRQTTEFVVKSLK